MFNKKILIIFLSIFSVAFGQAERIVSSANSAGFELTVKAPVMKTVVEQYGNNKVLDYTSYTNVDAPGSFKTPYDELVIAIPAGSTPKITIGAVHKKVYANSILKLNQTVILSKDSSIVLRDVPFIQSKRIAAEPEIEIKNTFWFRDFYCVRVRVRLSEYNYGSNSVEEVTNYKLNVSLDKNISAQKSPVVIRSEMDKSVKSFLANADIAEQFRANPPAVKDDTTGAWIHWGKDYVKIGVADDRIYRITKRALDSIGVSTSGISFSTFQLFEKGKELPLYIPASEDYIEFYGHKNYNPISPRIVNPDSLPYNELMDRFTDTTIYFLTWGYQAGIRAAAVDAAPVAGITDTLNYYNELIHFEQNTVYQEVSVDELKNQDPERLDSKSNFGAYLAWFIGDLKYDFYPTDVVAGKKAGMYSRLLSSGSSVPKNSHVITFGFKKFPALSSDTTLYYLNKLQSVDRNQRVVLGGQFLSDSLSTGKNTLVLRSYDNGTNPNLLLFDWYEVEYPRSIKANNDSLFFAIKDSIAIQKRIVKITNVKSDAVNLVLYRVKPDIARITNYQKTGTNIYFTDSVGLGYAYYLFPTSNIKGPDYLHKKQFANLRSTSRKGEYIGITHPSLFTTATSYLAFIHQNYTNVSNAPIDTALIVVDDIFDEFAYGYPDPASIRSFLHSAFVNWQSPKPAYLNLIGSACYDYKRYYNKNKGLPEKPNLVPSFGEPVSDAWFTMWDDANTLIQQMLVGRIPSETEADLNRYLSKHAKYINQRYNLWNKRAIFFSGGDGNDSLQLAQLKLVNDIIALSYVDQPPTSLNYDHFYKTYSPSSDFGPYEPLYVRRAIEKGGLFISYIGHSGTRTWDNSIDNPDQLLNTDPLDGKYPLVTDFGCSTNKFAEPDVDSFGGLFVNDGQTIAYIGNSSLGFTPTSTTVPILFYGKILQDTVTCIAEAHFKAKIAMFNTLGNTGWYRVFALTNVMLGDPIVKICLPVKPNLTLAATDISLLNTSPNDQMDSLGIKLHVYNYGTVVSDSFNIKVSHAFEKSNKDTTIVSVYRMKVPNFVDSLTFYIRIKNAPGQHTLAVQLDPEGAIKELYTDDNKQAITFNVASLSLKPLSFHNFPAAITPLVKVLNTTSAVTSIKPEIIVEYDTVSTFSSSYKRSMNVPWDTFYTKISFSGLSNKRYWSRFRVNQADTLWSSVAQIYKTDKDASFLIEDFKSFDALEKSNVTFDGGIKLSKDSIFIRVESSGGNYIKYGSINKNGINIINNTFAWGVGIAVFDPVTFNVDTAKTFDYGNNHSEVNQLARLIESIPTGKIVCACVIDDGTGAFGSDASLGDTLASAMKKLGSTLFAKLSAREPWVLISKKGIAGAVFEAKESNTFQGVLKADTVFIKNNNSGYFITPQIAQTGKLQELNFSATAPAGSSVQVRPVVTTTSGITDTLSKLTLTVPQANSYHADLSSINTTLYSQIGFIADITQGADGTSPLVNSFALQYAGLPELGVNYQGAAVPSDTFYISKTSSLNIVVTNAGSISADSVKIVVREMPKDSVLDSRMFTSIPADAKVRYTIPYEPALGDAHRQFVIAIDPDNKIKEYYKDNNSYSLPFYVSVDTTLKPELRVFFDSLQIFDGGFVAQQPSIRIEFHDPSLERIDTNYAKVSFKIYLDDNLIGYSNPKLSFQFQDANPKMIARFTPTLDNGEHTLKIEALSLNLKDTVKSVQSFLVNEDLTVSSVYNYPNPIKEKTNFTFQLSQIPDELSIKIYTVAGRLIKVIKKSADELNVGFNKKIEWDCRDEDGDVIANGVYLYRLTVKKDGKSVTGIYKLAIIR